jgi:hypothetical protein
MKRSKRFYIAGGAIAVLVLAGIAAGAGVAIGAAGDDDKPITGQALEDCTAGALAAHPGGAVTETEAGDDGAAYGVEVRLEDGSQVEVNLDENCNVIGEEQDDDGPNDDDGGGDDD